MVIKSKYTIIQILIGRPTTFETGSRRAVGYLMEVAGDKPIDLYSRSDANAFRGGVLRLEGCLKRALVVIWLVLGPSSTLCLRRRGCSHTSKQYGYWWLRLIGSFVGPSVFFKFPLSRKNLKGYPYMTKHHLPPLPLLHPTLKRGSAY